MPREPAGFLTCRTLQGFSPPAWQTSAGRWPCTSPWQHGRVPDARGGQRGGGRREGRREEKDKQPLPPRFPGDYIIKKNIALSFETGIQGICVNFLLCQLLRQEIDLPDSVFQKLPQTTRLP